MKVKQPYNLSAAAELAALVTMQNVAKTEANIARIRRQRADFYQKLAQIDWLKPYPSQTNFILCQIQGRDGRKVQAQLRKKSILIRYFDEPGLRNSLRISMGTAEQMQTVLQALKEIR
jgi:histidinol-phosphate aminotransferase